MIKKLKAKFILLSMVALFTLLVVIVAGMNLINFNTVVSEADDILTMLSSNHGRFPDPMGGKKQDFMSRPMSPETPFESRFFTVQFDRDDNVVFVDVGQIAAIDKGEAQTLAAKVLENHSSVGFSGNFRFMKSLDENGVRITFLDCGRKLDAFRSFLFTSLFVSLFGYIIITVFIVLMSGRILKPVAEAYEKQKRFITDAGHEIKTPLTIIGANVDVLEMDIGENESLKDIKLQTERLSGLTNDLVYLSRMEEVDAANNKIDFPISDLVFETTHSFIPVATAAGKEILMRIEPMRSMCGDAKAIEKLVSILLNNALKYSPTGSQILVSFGGRGKELVFTVENQTVTEIQKDTLPLVFDRFYRADQSRNSETGGHGIGLSMAKAIVTAHGGKIFASAKDAYRFEITAVFNL